MSLTSEAINEILNYLNNNFRTEAGWAHLGMGRKFKIPKNQSYFPGYYLYNHEFVSTKFEALHFKLELRGKDVWCHYFVQKNSDVYKLNQELLNKEIVKIII